MNNYDLYFQFIKAYEKNGFKNINRNDSLILELEELTSKNKQFFFIADLLKGQIIYTSKRSKDMFGLNYHNLNPYDVIEIVKPEELHRNTKGWAKLLNLANGLFLKKEGHSILSINMKLLNPVNEFLEILFQCFLFYSKEPLKTVYEIQIFTDLSDFKLETRGYHYYVGDDISNFRYPDDKLLHVGISLTKREFEILQLIESGLSTKEIADKLFLSEYTVNAHRRNILKNTNKLHISDVIYDLLEQGLI